jgi:DNA-binding response OmpR family regulator
MSQARVLFLSADVDARELYREWFARTAELQTICPSSVSEAVKVAESGRADVILVDLVSWRQWDDCTSLGETRLRPPVVVLTGWVSADGRFRRRAFAHGCAAFVAKPCHPRVLVAVLRRVLDGERHIAIA